MTSQGGHQGAKHDEGVSDDGQSSAARQSRRDVVRQGIKLAFVAPVLATFLASPAYAAYSCYPQGHACTGGGDWEPCCPGLTCQANKCEP